MGDTVRKEHRVLFCFLRDFRVRKEHTKEEIMKKGFAMLLALTLVLSLGACAKTNGTPNTTAGSGSSIGSALELLNTVWDKIPEDQKFSAIGGDNTEENMTDGAPGVYGLDNADELDQQLGFPAASVDQLQNAASLIHMLNVNTFTCGAYQLKDESQAETLAGALRDNIQARRWMCGFPDKVVVISVEDCLVSVFGAEDLVNTFRDTLTETYAGAKILYDEPIQ